MRKRRNQNLAMNSRSITMKTYARSARYSGRAIKRKASGVVIGIVNVAVLTPIILAASLMLFDAGLTQYYRQKAGFVLEQAGLYATTLPESADGSELRGMVSDLLKQSGITVWNLRVQTHQISSPRGQALEISLSGQFPLIEGTAVPSIQVLQASKTIPVAINQRFAQVTVNAFPFSNEHPDRGPSVYIPLLRPDAGKTVWSFQQQDESIQAVHVVAGKAPTLSALGETTIAGLKSIY
jgi:hypothetical protein